MRNRADDLPSMADRALAERDPEVAGLPLLLDADAMAEWLGELLGVTCRVIPGRLRYKAGTSCVASFVLQTHGGEPQSLQCIAHAYNGAGVAKAHKSIEQAPRETVLAFDRGLRVVVTTLAADRALPGVRSLTDPGARARLLERLLPDRPELAGASLRTLRHNPERRWVAVLDPAAGEPVVLRAYRKPDARQHWEAYDRIGRGAARTPALLATSRRHAVAAVEWAPGAELSYDGSDADGFAAAGRTLAGLHDHPPVRLREVSAESQAGAVRAAARHVGVLLPDLGVQASTLAEQIATELARRPQGSTVLHGDFSADQAIRAADGGVTLIDLDAACRGDRAIDLGSARAAALIHATVRGDAGAADAPMTALLDGYGAHRQLPDSSSLALHTAAHLLRRAPEPFRHRQPDWDRTVHAIVMQAGRVLDSTTSGGRVG